MRGGQRHAAAWLCGLLCAGVAIADEAELPSPAPTPALRPDLVLTTSLDAWSGTRRLDDAGSLLFPVAELKGSIKSDRGLSLQLDGLAAGRAAAFGSDSSHVVRHTAHREFYLAYRSEGMKLRLGERVIAWGRADLINPTDNLPARKYTWLVASDDEQKAGPVSLDGEWSWGDRSLQLVWQPMFRPHELPLPPVPGFRYVDHAPTMSLDAGAIRYDVTNPELSWSLSYFQGPSKWPALASSPAELMAGRMHLEYPFERVFGGDFEWLAGKWVLRGEAAYHRVEGSGSDVLGSRQSYVLAVLGVERNFGDWSVFLQPIYRHTFDYLDPKQVPPPLDRFALGAAVLGDQRFRNLAGVGSGLTYNSPDLRTTANVDLLYFERVDNLSLRPRIGYRFSDALLAQLGADFFDGSSEGPLGRLRDNRLAFVRIEYAFATH